MTNILTNVENVICTDDVKKNTGIDCLILYLKIRQLIKTDKAKELVREYIIKDKAINSGRYTIKGTRIAPEDIWKLMDEKKNINIEQILEEFPSLENENQVAAAIIFCSKKKLNPLRLMFEK